MASGARVLFRPRHGGRNGISGRPQADQSAGEHRRVLQQDQFQNAFVQFFRTAFAQGAPVSVQNHTQVAWTGRFWP